MLDDLPSIFLLREQQPARLVAFCGSGISAPSPTSLPLGSELVVSLLNLDWVDGDEKFPLSESEINRSNLRGIRFEHLLSVFAEWGKHDLAALLNQFADAEPNAYHLRLAELCKQGIIDDLVTTNFDGCLEKSLHQKGVDCNIIVSAEDPYIADSDVVNLLKIHGSITRQNAGYQATALGATLESVSHGLPAWRRNLLLQLLDGATCAFLGYSGSDSYDINPLLFEMRKEHLYWIAHTQGATPPWIAPEVLNILACSRAPKPICLDTAVFLGIDPVEGYRRTFRFLPTYDLDKHFHPSVFVGRVLEALGDYASALDYYLRVKHESTLPKYWMVEMLNIVRSIAVCHYELGNYHTAQLYLLELGTNLAQYVKRMKEDGQTPKEFQRQVIMDQGLLLAEEQALVQAQLGEWDSAFANIEVALSYLANQTLDLQKRNTVRSRLLLNRASIAIQAIRQDPGKFSAHELRMASEDLENAALLKQIVADVPGLIQVYASGGMCSLLLGKYEDAAEQFFHMYSQLQKIKTPLRLALLRTPAEVLCYLLYNRLTEGGGKDFSLFLQSESPAKTTLKELIIQRLLQSPFRDLDEALAELSGNPTLVAEVARLRADIEGLSHPPLPSLGPDSKQDETANLTRWAEALLRAGHYDRAIQIFAEVIARDPANIDAYINRSNAMRLQAATSDYSRTEVTSCTN